MKKRILCIFGLCLLALTVYGQRRGTLMIRKENFIDIREQLGLRAAIVKKNTVPVPALWQRMVEARECDELLILPDGDILLGTIDLRSKVKSVIGGALTGHGVYALFPNYSTLYKVDARSGAILWKYERAGEMGSAVHRFVDVSDDALVIQQGNEKKEYLLQLDLANGKEQWRQEIESGAQCRRIGDNILVFHLSGKEVLSCTCYSLPNRTQVYAKTLGNVSDNYLLTEFGTGKIAVTDDTACLLIDAATGDMVERTEAVTAFVNIYATPAFLLLVSGNGDCVMLDGEGRELWNIRIGLPPLLCDEWEDNVYWITQGEGVTSLSAIDKSSGERRWSRPLDGPVMSGFVVHGETLALTTASSLWFIDTGTGVSVEQVAVPATKKRIPDLIQRRNDRWVVTYETAVECYDNDFVKQWEYGIDRFVKRVEEPEIPGADKYATGDNSMQQAMTGFYTSMFSLQQSINSDYAKYVRYGTFNPTSSSRPTSIAGVRQSARIERQSANFAFASTAAIVGASIYFDIMAQKIQAEYVKADFLRAMYTYRLGRRETEATNQGDYYIRRFETNRSRNLLVVDLNDGCWTEIVLGPRESADVEDNALLNTCLYVYHPGEDMIVANGIGLDPAKWETTEVNKTTTVKSSLLSFRIADMNFRPHAEYADYTIAK